MTIPGELLAADACSYSAFISYNHRDRHWAQWVHHAIESYRIPASVHSFGVTRPGLRRLKPVFLDRAEMPTSSDLAASVRDALSRSAYLLVVCSPNASESRWVNEEIRLYRQMGGAARILCLIVAGDPIAKDAASGACFPAALREGGAEPLAADVRPGMDDRRTTRLKILSGLLGVSLDTLVRRDHVRRHRQMVLVSVAASVAAVLFAGLALAAWQSRNEAERQRLTAVRQELTAQRTTDFMKSLFFVSDPSEARGQTITAREVLDRGAQQIRSQLKDEPTVRAELGTTLAEVYTGLGLMQQGLQLLTDVQSVPNPPMKLAARQAVVTGEVQLYRGELPAAMASLDSALALLARTPEPQAELRIRALVNLGSVYQAREDVPAARARYQQAVDAASGSASVDPSLLSQAIEGLALCDQTEEHYVEAQRGFERALALQMKSTGEMHPRVAVLLNQLGGLAYFRGDRDRAADYFQRTLALDKALYGEQHPEVAITRNNLARVLLERRRFAQARTLLRDALAARSPQVADTDGEMAFIDSNLALAELGMGDYRQAEQSFAKSLAVAIAVKHRLHGPILTDLGDFECRRGRARAGLARLDEARPLVAERYPDDPWRSALIDNVRAGCLTGVGRYAEAEALFEASMPAVLAQWPAGTLYGHDALQRGVDLYTRTNNEKKLAQYAGLSRLNREPAPPL